MKAKNLLLLLLMSVMPFIAFAQDDWDDIYAPSKVKNTSKKEVKAKKTVANKQTAPAQKVLVVRDNGDVSLETEGNVNVDVDAYNRRGGNITVYEKDQYSFSTVDIQ